MDARQLPGASARKRRAWVRYALIVLVVEKIAQHVAVTLAFVFNWAYIRDTVAVNPSVLVALGALVAVLFAVSLWGLLTQRQWSASLVIGLAVFDIAGEFVAQGKLDITITVSFLVAILLLVVALLYRREGTRAV